jgi:hypothetical protein
VLCRLRGAGVAGLLGNILPARGRPARRVLRAVALSGVPRPGAVPGTGIRNGKDKCDDF